jgi:hypothetical protein
LNLVEVSTRPVLARHNPFQKPAVFRMAVEPPEMRVEEEEGKEEEAVKRVQEKPSGTEYVFLPLPARSSVLTSRPHRFYLSRLLRSLDYFLDLGADSTFPSSLEIRYSYRRTPTPHSQFIHRSGSVLVSIFEDDKGAGLAYAPNRIFASHHPEVDPGKTVEQLAAFCADEQRLKAFYSEQS